MADQVKVEDLEVFRLFRVALLKFAQTAGLALTNGDSEIARAHSWLEGEQMSFWQGQLRKRTEAVTRARDAVRAKKMFKDASGRTPDTSQEDKILSQCLAAVEQAEMKIKAIRGWLPKLEKAAGEYRGGVSGLNRLVSGEIPQAVALLDRLAMTLEEYMQIEAPAVNRLEPDAAGTTGDSLVAAEGSMSRGGEGGAGAEAALGVPATAEDKPTPATEGQGTPAEGKAGAEPADQAQPQPKGGA